MAEKYVPLTMGSPRFRSVDVGPFKLTEAWFPAGLVLPPHLHDRTTFAVMLDGSFDLQFARKTYACEPSFVFTEPLGDKHANTVGTRPAHVLVLQPDGRDEVTFDPCKAMFDRVTHFRHTGIHGLGWRVAHEMRLGDGVSKLAMQGLGLEMLALAGRDTLPRERRTPGWLRTAMEIIHADYRSDLDISALAAHVGVHPSHLAREFRRHRHESIGSFVRRLRLDWAQTRLATSEDPISQIALEAGFADQSHFTRAFKRYCGVSPARYRSALSSRV